MKMIEKDDVKGNELVSTGDDELRDDTEVGTLCEKERAVPMGACRISMLTASLSNYLVLCHALAGVWSNRQH